MSDIVQLLTPLEVAVRYGVSEREERRIARAQTIPGLIRFGSVVRFNPKMVEEYNSKIVEMLKGCEPTRNEDLRAYGALVERIRQDAWSTEKRLCERELSDKFDQIKTRARSMATKAISEGKIIRQPCSACGKEQSEGHHESYLKPLDLTWLCRKHHSARHAEMKRLAKVVAA